jgi:hypothetical protein
LLKDLKWRHDWLVVMALVPPELEELELPEPVEPDELEPEVPELAEPEPVEPEELEPEVPRLAESEPVEPEPEPVEPEELVGDAAAPVELWVSAGSCPETSSTKITPQIRTNVEAATATARLRIRVTRRRRASSRAATPPVTPASLSRPVADVVVRLSRWLIAQKPPGQMSEGRVSGVSNSYEL